jgi:cobalt-zinc-cadmium efflux system outer membrane protein
MKKMALVSVAMLGACASEGVPPMPPIDLPAPGAPAEAEKRTVRGMTLEQALQMAEQTHPDLARAKARVDAALGRAQQAAAFPNPEIGVRMESARLNGATTDDAEFLAGVAQPIPLGGRLDAARRVEERDRQRLLHELEVKRLEVRRRVQGAFAAVLYLDRVSRAQEETLVSWESAVKIAQARVQAGDAIPEEVSRVEIEVVRLRLAMDRVRSLRQVGVASLSSAIGEPALEVESVEGSLESGLELPALETLTARLQEHPLLASAIADVDAQAARVELAEAQRIPDINLELFYRRIEGSNEHGFDVGASIALPVFDRNQGRIREARADVLAARAQVRSARNELALELKEAHAELVRALSASKALRDELIPRIETVLKGAEARYKNGDTSLFEVLPIRRERTELQLGYLESLREVMQAWARLSPYLAR